MIINLLRNFFNTPLKAHILLLIGLVFFLSYFYFLFIFQRPIRGIPFTLNLWSFCALITIISLQIYLFYRYFKPSLNSVNFLTKIIQNYLFWVFDSLLTLDNAIKALPFIRNYYEKILLKLIFNVEFINIRLLRKSLICLNILPRIILMSVFFLDVFYFKKLYYIYNVIGLGILLFFGHYLLFCIKTFNTINIDFLEKNVKHITTTYEYGILPPEDDYWSDNYIPEEDEEEPNEEPPTEMCLSVKKFLEYRWWCVKNNDKHKDDSFHCTITKEYRQEFIKTNNILTLTLTHEQSRSLYDSVKEKIPALMKSHQLLHLTRDALSDIVVNETIRRISLLILWLYFLSWVYILIVSISKISLIDTITVLIDISRILEEPFSGFNLFREVSETYHAKNK